MIIPKFGFEAAKLKASPKNPNDAAEKDEITKISPLKIIPWLECFSCKQFQNNRDFKVGAAVTQLNPAIKASEPHFDRFYVL